MITLRKTLTQDSIFSSGRLLEFFKTMLWIAIAISLSLVIGQLH